MFYPSNIFCVNLFDGQNTFRANLFDGSNIFCMNLFDGLNIFRANLFEMVKEDTSLGFRFFVLTGSHYINL